jgi:YHS domain-containing protein
MFIVYIIIKFFRFLNKLNLIFRSSKEPNTQPKKTNLMVKDEVCNTYLPKDDAIEFNFKGQKLFFCSNECKQKFLKGYKGGFLKNNLDKQ